MPGYEREREKVIANTRALLEGKPANNVLLYGDAGTGKSSAIKAIANAFADQGLRLVEVKKNQLYQIPDLIDQLAANPLKFILFIDDLSFSSNDDNFAALKAILEGSVGGRARNIAVYATSNRRHLIKETLTDRTGDDIHEADTRHFQGTGRHVDLAFHGVNGRLIVLHHTVFLHAEQDRGSVLYLGRVALGNGELDFQRGYLGQLRDYGRGGSNVRALTHGAKSDDPVERSPKLCLGDIRFD